MRGGALRLYQPNGGQKGRGLGGLLRKATSNYGRTQVIPFARKTLKRGANVLIDRMLDATSKKIWGPGQKGGAIGNKRMRWYRTVSQTGGRALRRRRRKRKKVHRDIFRY